GGTAAADSSIIRVWSPQKIPLNPHRETVRINPCIENIIILPRSYGPGIPEKEPRTIERTHGITRSVPLAKPLYRVHPIQVFAGMQLAIILKTFWSHRCQLAICFRISISAPLPGSSCNRTRMKRRVSWRPPQTALGDLFG